MLVSVHIINNILPILYAAAFAVYYYDFKHEKTVFTNSKRIFLFITLVIHTFYLLARTIEFNHPPITNKFEIFTVLAFAISFAYFILELSTDIRGTGSFIIIFSLLFQIVSSIFIEDLVEVKEILRNRLLGLHVFSALLGYSGFTLSAVYGILFILLYKEIKLSRFGLIFKKLPNLEILEKLSFYSVVIGFILLSVATVIGIIWLPIAFPDFSYADPKLITTAIVWLIYAIGISSKLLASWYGKKVIIFSLAGFSFALISMLLTSIFSSSFHAF